MKKIILLVVIFLVVVKKPSATEACNIDTARLALPPRIFYESRIAGNKQSVLVTRFFHNKAGILLSEFGKCYALALDPNYLNNSLNFLGLLGWFYGLFVLVRLKQYPALVVLSLLPVIAFFNVNLPLVLIGNKLIASFGLLAKAFDDNKI